jgi:type IV pilus assembly protein PilC
MRFIFKAKDQEGKYREGTVETMSKEEAVAILQKNNFVPVLVYQEEKVPKIIKDIQKIWEGIGEKEKIIFFRQLAILIDAKVPLIPALKAINDQTDNKYFQIIIVEIIQDVEGGVSFSESLSKHPDAFSPMMISMIKSGEVSGNLQKTVTYIADNIEKNYRLSSKIKGALFYPAFVISAAIIIGFIVITFILPKLTGLIKEMGVAIPWYTQVLITVGDFMAAYWWAVLIGFIGLIIATVYYLKSEDGKKELDQIKLKIPVLGTLYKYVYMARFADNFGILLVGGIPVVKALSLVSEVIGNSVFEGIILRAVDEVKTGGNISTVFQKSEDVIPPILAKMVRIGEETGKMSEVLRKIATFYEAEVDRMTESMVSLIEPILIVCLGIGVAIMVFAILLPIYDIAGKM